MKNVVNSLTVPQLDIWSRDLQTDFIVKDRLFRTVELTKNADPDKYSYSKFGIQFDLQSHFLIPCLDRVKNVNIFGVENSSSTHTDNIKENVLVLGEGQRQRLDNITITAEATYSINFTRSKKLLKCAFQLR